MWFCTNCQSCWGESAVTEYKGDFFFLYGAPIKVKPGMCTCDDTLVHYDTWEKFKEGVLSEKQFKNLAKKVIKAAKQLHKEKIETEASRKPTDKEEIARQEKIEREKEALKRDHEAMLLREKIHRERLLFLTIDIALPVNVQADDALQYADQNCSICDKSNGHPITESGWTRYYAGMIHWYISERYKEAKTKGFMIGVAHKEDTKTIMVAFSGSHHDPDVLLERVTFKGLRVEFCSTAAVEFTQTISRRKIPESVLKNAVTVVGKMGDDDADSRDTTGCAASKLFVQHILKGGSSQGWHMTEMTYGTIKGYEDGEPARSCAGCKVMLPCLLCDSHK
jgi:hypothetical protein